MAAAVFVVVAGVLIAVDVRSDELGDWGPNLATEALGIAVTVLIIERVFRLEEKRRRAPRVEAATSYMHFEFMRFAEALAHDYGTTHRQGEIPRDAFKLIERWLDRDRELDAPHVQLYPWGKTLRDLEWDFANHIDPFERSDRDVLEPEIVQAVRMFWLGVRSSRERLAVLNEGPPRELAAAIEEHSYRSPVRQAQAFGKVLRRHAGGEYRISDDEVAAAERARTARFVQKRYPPRLEDFVPPDLLE